MIQKIKENSMKDENGKTVGVCVYAGLSTDTKPASANGSTFIEMDTSKVYMYDAESDWTEITV